MRTELSVILRLRDAEPYVARLVKGLATLGRQLPAGTRGGTNRFEILAMDERSRDNTLSVLSLLSNRIPELQSFQDVPRGTAIMRASRLAQGRAWLILEGDVDLELAAWATREVLAGHTAATIYGELLAVEREFASAHLGWMRGGLITAQREIKKGLARRGERPLQHPMPTRGLLARAQRWIRMPLARLGLARVNRLGPGSGAS